MVILVIICQQTFAITADKLVYNTTSKNVQNTIYDEINNPFLHSSYQELSLANQSIDALASNTIVSLINETPKTNDNVTITSNEDRKLNVDILKNDFDIDGDKISIIDVSDPPNGTTNINKNNNTLSYKPDSNFYGVDTFNYEISDGHNGTATGVVTVNVSSVNDIPIANNDTFTTKEDVVPNPFNVLSNDRDADREDNLTLTLLNPPKNGSANVNDNNSTISYIPHLDFNGVDTFNYEISDGHNGTATGVVTVNVSSVNDIPIANNDMIITNEDTPIHNFDVLSNDKDVDIVDSIHILGVTNPPNGKSSYSNNTISYKPRENFNGNDSFTYIIEDNNNSTAKGTVTIQVISINDPPIAINDTVDTFEDFPLTIDALQNDEDTDSNKTSLHLGNISRPPTIGNISTNIDNTIKYTPYTPTFAALFKESKGKPVQDNFTYTVFDEYNKSDIGTVTVTIKSVLEAVRNFASQQFTVSPTTRTILTMNMYPFLLQGDPKTDININGALSYLNHSGIKDKQPINIDIQKNQTQTSNFSITDLIYDLIKRPDLSTPAKFPPETATTDDNGNYQFSKPLPLEHGYYTVIIYPRNDPYNDLKVSSSFVVERPPLPLSTIAASLIPIFTVGGIGIAALKVLPSHFNKKKQNKIVLIYMDKINNITSKIEAGDLKEEITDLLLRNKITKEHFDILDKTINDVSQKY